MTISRNRLQGEVVTLAAVAILATCLSVPAGAETQIIHELSVDLEGIPLYVVASPDGRFVYVTTAPPFESLLTFERVGQQLVLRDSFTSGDDGITFQTVALAITDDGRYLLLGSFIGPAGLQVFELDMSSGLPRHLQTITHPDLGTVDGVSASFGAVVWGQRPFPETGSVLVRLERNVVAGGRSAGRPWQEVGQFFLSDTEGFEGKVIDATDEHIEISPFGPIGYEVWVAIDEEGMTIRDDGGRRCPFTLEELLEALGVGSLSELSTVGVSASLLFRPRVELLRPDRSGVSIQVDMRDCTLKLPRELVPPPLPGVLAMTDALSEQTPLDETNTVASAGVGTDGTKDESQVVHVRFLDGDSDDDDARMEDREARFRSGPHLDAARIDLPASLEAIYYDPENGPRGLPSDVGVSALLIDTDSSFQRRGLGTGSQTGEFLTAYIYSIVSNPPAIHAFRFTTDELDMGGCTPSSTTACLSDNAVSAEFTDFSGNSGPAQVVPGGSSDSGLFRFFDPDNWELLVKVLDACALSGHYWFFAAGTTNVGVELTVENPETGETRQYTQALGEPFKSIVDTELFACPGKGGALLARRARGSDGEALGTGVLPAYSPPPLDFTALDVAGGACQDTDTGLCLNDSRYLVEVEWWDFKDNHGSGQVVPLRSADSGLFWFFGAANWEMLVKVLDGCGINQHRWVLAAATTNVGYRLTVTDTVTGAVRQYDNELGTPALALADVEAFATCP